LEAEVQEGGLAGFPRIVSAGEVGQGVRSGIEGVWCAELPGAASAGVGRDWEVGDVGSGQGGAGVAASGVDAEDEQVDEGSGWPGGELSLLGAGPTGGGWGVILLAGRVLVVWMSWKISAPQPEPRSGV